MEDFLKEKLNGLEHNYQDDWPEFEEKLERALFFKRMRVGALVSAFLILVSIGIFGTSSFMGDDRGDKLSTQPEDAEQSTSNTHKQETETGTTILPEKGLAEFFNQPMEEETDTDFLFADESRSEDQSRIEAKASPIKENALSSEIPQNAIRQSAEVERNTTSDLAESGQAGEKALAENRSSSESAPEVYSIDNQPRPANSINPKGAPLASAKMESSVELKDPLAEQEDERTASLEVNTLSLDNALQQGKSKDLGVRPPVAPVKLDLSSEPYISPMQERNPWSVAVSVYPNFTFRQFKVDQEKVSYIHRDFVDATQSSERGGFSLNIGLRVSRRVGPITYLNSGVEYINYKTEAEFNFTNFRDASINEETGEITHYKLKAEPENISFVDANLYHYLNVPLSISHQPWATDHIRLNIEAGGSFMYFLAARGKSINYRTLEVIDISERDYRNYIGSFSMKIGATYHVSRKFNFGFEPTLMYFTNTIYTESYPFRVIPYSVGVNLKLQMKLN